MTLIDKHGRSISHVAAMHGFHQILEYSLNLDDKCLNIPDKTGVSPCFMNQIRFLSDN